MKFNSRRIECEQRARRCFFGGTPTPLWSAYSLTQELIDAAEPQTMAGALAIAKAARHEATANPDGEEDWSGFLGEKWAPKVINALVLLHGEA